ncbi:MAG: sigma-70 family RNA polymerase sigma factor [Verrucomicrobiota bacterium]
MTSETSNPGGSAGDIFATTHWTVVLAAGRRQTPQADIALGQLCQTYWYPLYAYVRRRGHSREDAEDLTQAFFARLLGQNFLEHVNSDKGRFRAFLLAALKHFLANEWDKTRRQKRGGGVPALSLDWQTADTKFQVASGMETPDQAFDREWALALLTRVINRLQEDFAAAGKAKWFETLRPVLTVGKSAVSYPEAATTLGISEEAVRVAAHRLRKRYRELLRDEIAHTLADPAQAEEEIRALFGVFTR